jgi:hypothetical protein
MLRLGSAQGQELKMGKAPEGHVRDTRRIKYAGRFVWSAIRALDGVALSGVVSGWE